MANCIDCKQDMRTATGCVIDELNLDGITSERGQHHHLGCDAARCPKCEWQLFSCGCPFEEYGVSELEMLTAAA